MTIPYILPTSSNGKKHVKPGNTINRVSRLIAKTHIEVPVASQKCEWACVNIDNAQLYNIFLHCYWTSILILS